ncbi:lipid A deacylase LpxR family protein [Roseomonas frigidaquae]|uniref:Lipid A deacylase LpxR family protein n=1 Tax=Falsiroseomonas frigidaquae TaxID=487318 RepID=A0ABX1F3W7_9PROT|nr:lipid A deacylase LpxR family protein [Falsiroseomonas frigidaquae]NKE47061.1 lipid A deacylase LpxR family protein [Falsiroseomonas frigidaquae]
MHKATLLLTLLLAPLPTLGQSVLPSLPDALTPTVGEVTPPPPDPLGGWTFNYENDTLGGTDQNYSSGLQIAWRSPSADLPSPLRWLNEQATRLLGPGQVRWGAGLVQAIYTPQDTQLRTPDPRDRPYAGHLYGALVLQRDTGSALSTLEFQAGVVGPAALGEFVQNSVHEAIRVDTTKGWDSQLKDELALNLVFERTLRTAPLELGGLQADMLPSFTVALGNVSTYAGAGLSFRLGQGLEADYGAPRIRPALVGSAFFQPREEFGWYGFIGGQGRAVARDIFLDGNTWQDGGPSVDRRPLVADVTAGVVVHWRGLRLAYSHVWRTEEFYGQRGGLQSFGSVGFTARF